MTTTLPKVAEAGTHDTVRRAVERRDPASKRSAALERARQRLGGSLRKAEGETLTSLRLSKGLSQTQLAEMIGHRQPYIARLEKKRQDLRSSTVSKLAKALGVSSDVIIAMTLPLEDKE